MSGIRLPRGTGTVITCGGCGAKSTTGQITVGLHRAWLLSTQGWLLATAPARPGRRVRPGDDLCPKCVPADLRSATWHEWMARRIASREKWGYRVAWPADVVEDENGTMTPTDELRNQFQSECGLTPEEFLDQWRADKILRPGATMARQSRALLLERRKA